MNLICKINGKVYDKNIAQGLTISEEYNETLDSGAIILTHVSQIVDLKPYDDVWIYEKPEKSIEGQFDYVTVKNEEKNDPTHRKRFYRHFLVDNYSEKILNLEGGIYEYTIELFSETKLLEKIICPSTCVTEPLDIADKHDIEWYLDKYIDLYSPEIKRKRTDIPGNYWVYDKKYKIADTLREKVRGKYPQDFQLTNPTLREILTQLLLTQDLIPIVKDDVIDALDITQRTGLFHKYDIDDKDSIAEIKEYVNSITGSMSSDNYTDSLRKTYTEAISQECLSSNIERIGFRNKDSALLTLSNLQIETRFPIYSIEQAYLCYYKRLELEKSDGTILYQDVLCKQDITPFILLNSARNVLSKDWSDFLTENPESLSIEEITKYKMYTLGYDIGSNVITGWGEMYSYPSLTWDTTLTYIQNILYYLERKNPFGINLNNFITNKLLEKDENKNNIYKQIDFLEYVNIKNPFNIIPDIWGKTSEIGWTTDVGTKIKSMFVELKYKGFFKGTVITSKDGGRDYIQTSDNSNSSLTLLEKDGLAQKEKINRFGNKTMVFTARYPGDGYDLVQPLGCVYNSDNDKDIIIYHKEMAFYDNAITCTYYGARDYVLKNFYTSVRAKLRLNRLMSYEESVRRCENEKMEILFSKEKLYYDGSRNKKIIKYINSAFDEQETIFDSVSETVYNKKESINTGIIDKKYFTDLNKSVNGKSIIFNLAMYDNVSPGVYIDKIKPPFNASFDAKKLYEDYMKAEPGTTMTVGMYKAVSNYTDYTGSTQKWYLVADKNGEMDNVLFQIAFIENNSIKDSTLVGTQTNCDYFTREYYERSFALPKLSFYRYEEDSILVSGEKIETLWSKNIKKKDNKEILDQTFQIEYCLDEKDDVFIGQEYLVLNDMINSTNIKKQQSLETETNVIKLGYLFSGLCKTSEGKYPFIDLNFGNKDIFYKNIKKVFDSLGDNVIELSATVSNSLIFGEKNTKLGFTPEYQLLETKYNEFIQETSALGHSQSIDYMVSENKIYITIEYDKEKEEIKNCYAVVPVSVFYTIWDVDEFQQVMWNNYYEKDKKIKFNLRIVENSDNNIIAKTDFTKSHYSVEVLNNDGSQSSVGYEGMSNIMIDTIGRILNLTPYHPIEDSCIGNMYYSNETKYSSFVENDVNKDGFKGELFLVATSNVPVPNFISIPQTMFVVYSTNPCTKTTEYEQYADEEDLNGKEYYIKKDLKVSDVFDVKDNKIIVNKKGLTLEKIIEEDGTTRYANIDKELGEIKSIQYWYYDNSTHSYKFVFGINLTDATEESVYFSVVKNKDTRVFDENGEVVGHIKNFKGKSDFAQEFGAIQTLQTENNIV